MRYVEDVSSGHKDTGNEMCVYLKYPFRILASCKIFCIGSVPFREIACPLREYCTIISAPCIAADTWGFLYNNLPIKVLPHVIPCTCRTWGDSRGFYLLER